jgi:hypothetical protein
MFQFLSSHSKIFSKGHLYFSESKDQPHTTFIFNNDTHNTYQELITPFQHYPEYNYKLLFASYKGSIGALTISAKLLHKTTTHINKTTLNETTLNETTLNETTLNEATLNEKTLNEKTLNETTLNKETLENNLNGILSDITNLDNSDNLIESYDNQSRKFYNLSIILKKNYDCLVSIDQRKNVFEIALLSSNTFSQHLTEYYEYFNDCYETLMDKFSLLSDLCHKYNDNVKINLIQLLKSSSDLFASSLIIDQSCDIEVSNPFKIFSSIENLGQSQNYHNNTTLIHVNNNILYLLFINKDSPYDFHYEIDLNRS